MVRALERFGGAVVWQRVDTVASGYTQKDGRGQNPRIFKSG